MNIFQLANFWRRIDFFGKASFLFRCAAYLFIVIFSCLFLNAKGMPIDYSHLLFFGVLLIAPFVLLFYYGYRDNDKGVGIRQNQFDFLVIGWVIGLIQLTFIPSSILALGIIVNYIAARGFHKTYRFILIPLGYATTIPVFGFEVNDQTIPLLNNLIIIYAFVHFIATAYISYQFSKSVQIIHQKVLDQQDEIITQSEELQALNESLQALNINLEEKVYERTKELAAKNEKLAEYTFINGHQLRAPVATMLGLVQLLNYDNSELEKEEIINKLKKEVNLLNITIKEIRLKLETDQLIGSDLKEVEVAFSKTSDN